MTEQQRIDMHPWQPHDHPIIVQHSEAAEGRVMRVRGLQNSSVSDHTPFSPVDAHRDLYVCVCFGPNAR